MNGEIAYSARQDDLYTPGENAQFFHTAGPHSDALLCAELARLAYCRAEGSLAFDRDRIATVLKSADFTGCDFFEKNGSHAFFAHSPHGLGIVAFRGTDADDPTDLADDADIRMVPWTIGGRVHRGFAKALMELRIDLGHALQLFEGKVIFTGHSLGAAMATLYASLSKPSYLYTFGSPMVGDPEFVATLDGVPNYRYVDCCDVVTRIPPLPNYAHVGNPYYIDLTRRVINNPNADVIGADRTKARENYIVDYAWKKGNVAVRELADHAPINYVFPISAAG